jgi:choline kinase
MEEYKVLITTSGVGSRLGDLTKYTNKSLVRVGKKPAISYIVEAYPENIELVVTVGYYGQHVIDFLTLAYPNRKFTFVEVDKYEGNGSSLGYSLLKAKNELKCPFIFHAADTIVTEPIQEPSVNWIGTCHRFEHSQYRTVSFIKGNMIYEKGDMNSDWVYIGLAGIKDHEKFWVALQEEYDTNPNDSNLCDCHAINKMDVDNWEPKEYSNWLDIGNASSLKHARETVKDKFDILDKVDESIFLFNDFVIKFFYDKKTCLNRVIRAKELDGLTPRIIDYTDNFYKYEYAKGDLLASVVNGPIFRKFLDWSKENLWKVYDPSEEFRASCENFYFDKTNQRLDKFYKDHKTVDGPTIINGYNVPPVKEMLSQINRDWLCSDIPYKFHGDYILDNIIYNKNKEFTLLDWRQDFGGSLTMGDIYYDLSKLNHNLLFNHDIVHRDLFTITKKDNVITCDILRSDELTNCREQLHEWVKNNGLDLKKVKILTAIIWLNMSPLHDHKMGEFLYYFGALNLYKALKL